MQLPFTKYAFVGPTVHNQYFRVCITQTVYGPDDLEVLLKEYNLLGYATGNIIRLQNSKVVGLFSVWNCFSLNISHLLCTVYTH